jgi:hypothetical protein
MEQKHTDIKEELDDLKHEMEHFQQEKERVRAIIGKIGGVPKFGDKVLNIGFLIIIAGSLVLSVIGSERLRPVMIELAMVALSLKIIYLIHCQAKVNHFQFWILSSLEWRINEITKIVKDLQANNTDNQNKNPPAK